jgi:6-phospho-beta-glucosidase
MLQLEKDEFKVNGVRSQVVTKLEKSLFEKYKNPTLAVKPKELEERGGKGYSTVAVSVINAIYNNTNEEFVVSATNKNGMVVNAPHE